MTWFRAWRSSLLIALVAFVLALPAMAVASWAAPATQPALRIEVLSNRADLVSAATPSSPYPFPGHPSPLAPGEAQRP